MFLCLNVHAKLCQRCGTERCIATFLRPKQDKLVRNYMPPHQLEPETSQTSLPAVPNKTNPLIMRYHHVEWQLMKYITVKLHEPRVVTMTNVNPCTCTCTMSSVLHILNFGRCLACIHFFCE